MRNIKVAHTVVTIASGTAPGTSDQNRIEIEADFKTITGAVLYIQSDGGIKPRVGIKNGNGDVVMERVHIDHLTGNTTVPPSERFTDLNFQCAQNKLMVMVEWDDAPVGDLIFDFLVRTEKID